MRLKAHAKLNWVLNVLARRADGYHQLDMLTQRLALHDTLDISPADSLNLRIAGETQLPGGQDNLVIKAARALQAVCGCTLGADILLTKRIPSQAGLGGGSADAAATLLGLNELWGCGLSIQQLEAIALPLGADVPLCLHQGLMRVQGIGEVLLPQGTAKAHELLLIKPAEGLSTLQVFAQHRLGEETAPAYIPACTQVLKQVKPQDFSAFANQLQPTAIRLLPEIAQALDDLVQAGALYAQMTGSGSVVYGLFEDAQAAQAAQARLAIAWPVCIHTRSLA